LSIFYSYSYDDQEYEYTELYKQDLHARSGREEELILVSVCTNLIVNLDVENHVVNASLD